MPFCLDCVSSRCSSLMIYVFHPWIFVFRDSSPYFLAEVWIFLVINRLPLIHQRGKVDDIELSASFSCVIDIISSSFRTVASTLLGVVDDTSISSHHSSVTI